MPYLLALCSAFSAALGAAFQDREIATFTDEEAKGTRLLLTSIRKPMWWIGLLVMVGSPIFQYLALRVGNLTQVQPTLTTELLFVLVIIVVTHHQRPGAKEWFGSIGIVAGLSVFLICSSPSGDQSVISPGWAVSLSVGALALVGLFYGFSRLSRSWVRAALMGSAAATCFAYQAAMTQIVAGVSLSKIFTQPALIGLVVAGVSGFLFFQHALRDGHIADSRAAMVIVDPLLSVLIGVVAFHDRLGHTPARLFGEIIGLIMLVFGARQLAMSPLIAETGVPAEFRTLPNPDPATGGCATSDSAVSPVDDTHVGVVGYVPGSESRMRSFQMAVVSAHGIEIAYEQHGDPSGTPLLLIHGLGMQLIGWDPGFIAAFTELGYLVTVFDNRDMGKSTWLDELGTPDFAAILGGDYSLARYSVSDMAGDAAGLLDALGIESAHILGVSLGGMIAQQFAIDHEKRTRTLTSIMSTPDARSVGLPTKEAMAALTAPPPTSVDEAMDAAVAVAEVIGSPGFVMDIERIRTHAALAFERANHPEGTARQMAALLCSTDRRPGLASLAVRSLVVHGDADPLITPEGGVATAAALRESELWVIPGMGHDLPTAIWSELAERHLALVASTI